MIKKSSIAAAALCATVLSASCSEFLDSPKAVADPNSPTQASTNQLFVGVLANTFGNYEGPVPMLICQWMQQCAGVNGRFVETQGIYTIDAGTFDISFQNIYNGGGLIGIRAVEANATAAGDKLYLGIAETLEAMNMMFAADVWGDIPYSEAVGTNTTPKFDGQMTVYASLLTLLDKAITDMSAGGTGPAGADLVYGGNAAKWIEAAHTLKARIYLHQVEKLGNAQYTSALAEAKKGISTPANDWLTAHSSNTSERNMWAQFANTSFGPDLVAGSTLVNLMTAQNDSRIGDFFQKNSAGQYVGFDVATGGPDVATISALNTDPTRQQGIITYDENQLIIAEAALQTGDRATAVAAYNTVRTRHGKSTTTAAALTLADVMNEKYITTFQNPEAWNDYKRTCLPALKPAKNKTRVPGRIYYGQTEEQTNSNTPSSSSQNLFTFRNANDPNACS